jgi:hypothetical protein
MSREQRRLDRRKGTRAAAAAAPSRRTPVKARTGGGIPWTPIAIAAGTLAVVALIAYLIVQAGQTDEGTNAATEAEQNSDPSLPGEWFPSQGRSHTAAFNLERPPIPFCEGVDYAGADDATPEGSVTPEASPTSTPTPASTAQPGASPTRTQECYESNPPSSGPHLPAQRAVNIGGGVIVDIPAPPDVYPDDVTFPRDAIPHILEHAGVYIGYNCADGDAACQEAVDDLKDLANDRIDNHDDRVTMARDPDLNEGEIALASWTRVMRFDYQDYDRAEAERFIGTHSCRFDPEGLC